MGCCHRISPSQSQALGGSTRNFVAAWRRRGSGVFRYLVQLLIGLPFLDTQCGFKAFVREKVLPVFQQQRIERFGFDPEILFLARRQGLRILEVGVRWGNDPATRVRFVRDGARMLLDLLRVRWSALTGQYSRTRPEDMRD